MKIAYEIKDENFCYDISKLFNESIGCIDELFDICIKCLSKDVILFHSVSREFSYAHLSYPEEFSEFFSIILNKIDIDDDILYNTIYNKLVNLMKYNKYTLLECSMVLHKEYGFCIDDIGHVISTREELIYSIEQNFKDKNMFPDSFSHLKEASIDVLDW